MCGQWHCRRFVSTHLRNDICGQQSRVLQTTVNWWNLSIWSDRWILEAKKEKTRSRVKTNRIRHPRRGHWPTEYSRKAKVPFRELKWNYSVCFTNGKFPPHFLWFFILTHKLMFCKQMNPNTRRTFTKFVINRIKTIFGTACFDMCMIFTSVLHRLSQYMNAVNTDRMVLACFVSWRLCIWVLQIGFLLSRPPKQVGHIPEKLVC